MTKLKKKDTLKMGVCLIGLFSLKGRKHCLEFMMLQLLWSNKLTCRDISMLIGSWQFANITNVSELAVDQHGSKRI